MQKIFVLYNRGEAVSWDEYREWSIEADQKSTPFNPGIIRLDVWRAAGTANGDVPFEIIEEIEVDSWDDYAKLSETNPKVKEAVDAWTNKYADQSSALVMWCNRIH